MNQTTAQAALALIQEFRKQAFQPQPPPMDPAAQGQPPMDPAMMGMPPGAPPVDPATGMPMDPAMMGGAPTGPSMAAPPAGIPPEELEGALVQLADGLDQVTQVVSQLQQQNQMLEQGLQEVMAALQAPGGM
jgi:hypothetical protein